MMTRLFFVILIIVGFTYLIPSSYAHPGYNAEEEVIGKYRVTTSTIPEIPTTGQKTTIVISIYDVDYNPIKNFKAEARIFYNDEQVDTIPTTSIDGNHWDLGYVFKNPGNHVFRIDVEDAGSNGGTITYTFNISTLNPFGYIFTYIISAGGLAGGGIMIWSIMSRKDARERLKKSAKSYKRFYFVFRKYLFTDNIKSVK